MLKFLLILGYKTLIMTLVFIDMLSRTLKNLYYETQLY